MCSFTAPVVEVGSVVSYGVVAGKGISQIESIGVIVVCWCKLLT